MGNLFAFAEHLGCILLYYFLNLQLFVRCQHLFKIKKKD